MRASILVVMVVALVLSSCASRPKPHQPQPVDMRRVEISQATFALLTAVSDGDFLRASAYFMPQWPVLSGATTLANKTRQGSGEWLASVLHEPNQSSIRLEQLVQDGDMLIATDYDFETDEESGLGMLSAYRKQVGPGDVLVLVEMIPKSGVEVLGLVLIWHDSPEGWVLRAVEVLSADAPA
jgi:hypothetical protein